MLQFETNTPPQEVKVDSSSGSLVESHGEVSAETARCSVRKKHLELQVCNSWPMRSTCHDDDGIYRVTLLYMDLAHSAIDRMQESSYVLQPLYFPSVDQIINCLNVNYFKIKTQINQIHKDLQTILGGNKYCKKKSYARYSENKTCMHWALGASTQKQLNIKRYSS